MLKRIRANLLFFLVIISNPLWAQPESPPPMKTIDVDIAAHQIPKRVEPPKTFEVMTLVVKLDASVEIGESDSGVRRYVPITGGYFQGKNISGTVLAGGADWQLQRPDDVLEIDALYSIRTEDGQTSSSIIPGLHQEMQRRASFLTLEPHQPFRRLSANTTG
ncbi:DUF3237 domain-containing protein [Vibrio olivae]